MEEYYDDDYLETLEEKLMDEDEDFNYIAPARTKVKKKRLKDPIFSPSLSRVEGGYWASNFTSLQSFIIIFSYSLAQQILGLFFNFDCLVH